MSQVYSCSQTSPLSMDAPHDPNAELYYTIQYRAPAWMADSVYLEKTCGEIGDLVLPAAENGFLYETVSGGVSGPSEPTWATVTDELTVDNTISWKAIPNAFNLLSPSDTITSSEWSTDDANITLVDDGVAGGRTYVKVTTVPATISQFILTNRVTIQRSGALTEILDRSLKIKVKEM